MPTNTAGSVARDNNTQSIQYLRKTVTYADNGTAVTVGVLPSGSIMLKPICGVSVVTAFNAGTTNTLNIGTSADDNLYATLLALGTTTFVPFDEAVSNRVDADTTITATVVLTGTAATAGEAEILIPFIADNDG